MGDYASTRHGLSYQPTCRGLHRCTQSASGHRPQNRPRLTALTPSSSTCGATGCARSGTSRATSDRTPTAWAGVPPRSGSARRRTGRSCNCAALTAWSTGGTRHPSTIAADSRLLFTGAPDLLRSMTSRAPPEASGFRSTAALVAMDRSSLFSPCRPQGCCIPAGLAAPADRPLRGAAFANTPASRRLGAPGGPVHPAARATDEAVCWLSRQAADRRLDEPALPAQRGSAQRAQVAAPNRELRPAYSTPSDPRPPGR